MTELQSRERIYTNTCCMRDMSVQPSTALTHYAFLYFFSVTIPSASPNVSTPSTPTLAMGPAALELQPAGVRQAIGSTLSWAA
jgi:hypothetical protein